MWKTIEGQLNEKSFFTKIWIYDKPRIPGKMSRADKPIKNKTHLSVYMLDFLSRRGLNSL